MLAQLELMHGRPRRQLRRPLQGGERRRRIATAHGDMAAQAEILGPPAALRRQAVEQGGRLGKAVALVVLDRLLEVAVDIVGRGGGVHAVTLGNRQWRAPGRPSTYQTSSYRLNPRGPVRLPMTAVTRGREFKPPGQAISGISDGHHAACCNCCLCFGCGQTASRSLAAPQPSTGWPVPEAEVGGRLQ